jgi:hypothetical protein
MSWNVFIGHCVCSDRFNQMIHMIATLPLDEVMIIREHHLRFKRNSRYEELNDAFKARGLV